MRFLRPVSLVLALLVGSNLGMGQGLSRQATADTPGGGRIVGAVNGQPLRISDDRTGAITTFRLAHHREPSTAADQQEIDAAVAQAQCSGVRATIVEAARAAQMTRLGVKATSEEIAVLKAAYLKEHDLEAEAKKYRDDAIALVAALAEVYEHGVDQGAAYRKYLAPRGYAASAWEGNLVAGKSAEWRSNYLRGGNVTAKMMADALDPAMAKTVERDKLNAAVDEEIASGDPTFRAYIRDEIRNTVKQGFERTTGRETVDEGNYVRLKRAQWWRAREAEVNLVMNDQGLSRRCGIVPGSPVSAIPAPMVHPAPTPASAAPVTVTPTRPAR
jgi:hypothetical protein